MAQLVLENMEFYGFHGHYPEEQAIGGRYKVDLIFETNTDKAETSDDLSDTVDYSKLYELVKQEMAKPAKIMEHLARRILDTVMHNSKEIKNITVRLSKMYPQVSGKMERFQIVLHG